MKLKEGEWIETAYAFCYSGHGANIPFYTVIIKDRSGQIRSEELSEDEFKKYPELVTLFSISASVHEKVVSALRKGLK